jgi:hypothetical protein
MTPLPPVSTTAATIGKIVAVAVGILVGEGVEVRVAVEVGVGVTVFVGLGVIEGVEVGIKVATGVAVGKAATIDEPRLSAAGTPIKASKNEATRKLRPSSERGRTASRINVIALITIAHER